MHVLIVIVALQKPPRRPFSPVQPGAPVADRQFRENRARGRTGDPRTGKGLGDGAPVRLDYFGPFIARRRRSAGTPQTWRLTADAGAGGRSPRPVTRDRLAADPAAHGGAGSRPESVLPAGRLGGAGPHGKIHRKKHDKDIKLSTLFTPSSYAVWILDPWLSTLRRGNDPASNAGAVHRSGGAGQ